MLQFVEHSTGALHRAHHVKNKFLQSLSPHEFELLRPHLTAVNLKSRSTIHEEGRRIDSVYFIESGIVSRMVLTKRDAPFEIAAVGNSGFVGLSVVIGTSIALHRTVVLVSGTALRISASNLLDVMSAHPSVRETLLRYVHALMFQNAQLSLCNARHSIEQRLSRWLLLAQDRLGEGTLPVTHDLLAMLLGVRRPGVSTAIQRFEDAGALIKRRGSLTVTNRALLLPYACECYRIIEGRSFWRHDTVLHPHPFKAE